jgi:hypothetical protein
MEKLRIADVSPTKNFWEREEHKNRENTKTPKDNI